MACDADSDFGFGTKVTGIRAADVSFVLDRLTGDGPAWKGSSLIDPSKIAMAGQSMGGAGAVAAMVKDSRVRAGIDVEAPGPLTAARSAELTRTYVRAFLDLHLRAKPQPLLERPSPRHPEVTHCAPAARTCA